MQDNPEQFAGMSSSGLCPLYMDPVLMDVEAHSAEIPAEDAEPSEEAAE